MTSPTPSFDRDQFLKNLVIPPRPDILDRLLRLRDDPSLSLDEVGAIVGSDMALAAAMVKAANSPLFSRGRRTGSVRQAISLLGVKNVLNLASGLVLRSRLTGDAPASLERFWDRAMSIAMISNILCERLAHVPEDTRSYALFHGCGMALMLMRYPNYERTLSLLELATDDRVTRVEQELHGTSHTVVGYLVGRAWKMPEPFCRAILHQYDPDLFEVNGAGPLDPQGLTMVAVVRASLSIWRTSMPGRDDAGWSARGHVILDYLGLSQGEFEDLRDMLHERIHSDSHALS